MSGAGQPASYEYPPSPRPSGCGQRLKRACGCGCGSVVLLLVIFGAVDGILAARYGAQVQQELQRLRAAGKPLKGMDLGPPPVPDDQNAAPLYLKAAEIEKPHEGQPSGASMPAMPGGPPASSGNRVVGYDEADWDNPAQMGELARWLQQHREALALMREATARPQCRFDTQWQSVVGVAFPHYPEMRSLARFENAAAAVASFQGNQAEALDRLRIGLVASRRASDAPLLIPLLVGVAMDAMVMRSAGYVVSRGPLPEAKARQLAEELGRVDHRRVFARAMQGERVCGLETFEMVKSGSARASGWFYGVCTATLFSSREFLMWFYGTPAGPLLRPVLYQDELLYLRLTERQEEIGGKPWREAQPLAKQLQADFDSAPWWGAVTSIAMGVWSGAQTKAETAGARRDLLQIVLGLKVYRQRNGSYPDRVDALRKLNWPVPMDRFSGKPFVYRRQGNSFLLYSIGQDLKDDGGRPNWVLVRDKGRRDALKQKYGDDAGDVVWLDWKKG